jgi:4'-phosphopantetheinyl transferase
MDVVRWEEPMTADLQLDKPFVIVDDVRGQRPQEERAPSVCTPIELERAARFRHEINRAEYLRAREIVRSFLSAQVGVEPAAIEFEAGQHEKPRLRSPECVDIDVSLSHSGGRVACAFLRNGEIGVDIEPLDRKLTVDTATFARRLLSPFELNALVGCDEDQALALLLHAWTRKEAVLKAAAVGISCRPESFSVLRRSETSTEDISPVRLGSRQWTCCSLSPELDLEIAVAYHTPAGTTLSKMAVIP